MAAAPADRSPRRTGALPGLRHRADPPRQRARSAGHARDARRSDDRQHEDVPLGRRRRPTGSRAQSASRRNGSTRARGRSCARTASRSRCRPMPKTAAKRPRSPASTSSTRKASRAASAWPPATSSPIISSRRTNYLNLAGSKLRTCALGPELVDRLPTSNPCPAQVTIERARKRPVVEGDPHRARPRCATAWRTSSIIISSSRPIAGRAIVHVHFFGADSLSFGDGVELRDGDVMEIRFDGFGRALPQPRERLAQRPIPW